MCTSVRAPESARLLRAEAPRKRGPGGSEDAHEWQRTGKSGKALGLQSVANLFMGKCSKKRWRGHFHDRRYLSRKSHSLPVLGVTLKAFKIKQIKKKKQKKQPHVLPVHITNPFQKKRLHSSSDLRHRTTGTYALPNVKLHTAKKFCSVDI